MMVSRRRRTPQIRHAAVPPNAIVPRPTSGHLMATPPDGSPTEPSMTERSRTIAWSEPSALSAATRELSGLELFAKIIAGEQIGRASCRERVCQYVSISGVAVSLKKKRIQTHERRKQRK